MSESEKDVKSTKHTTICVTFAQRRKLREWAKSAKRTMIDELQFLMDSYGGSGASSIEATLKLDFYPYTLLDEKGLNEQQISSRNYEFNACFSKLSPDVTWRLTKRRLEVAMGFEMDDQLRPTGVALTMNERSKMKKELKKLWQGMFPEKFTEEGE